MGEEPGLTTARIRSILTALPKPIFTNLLSMNAQALKRKIGTDERENNEMKPAGLSFDILHLFSEFLNFIFHLYAEMGNAGAGNFRGEGVHLPKKLLQ